MNKEREKEKEWVIKFKSFEDEILPAIFFVTSVSDKRDELFYLNAEEGETVQDLEYKFSWARDESTCVLFLNCDL